MDPYYSMLVERVSVSIRNAYEDTQKDPVANIREQADVARRILWNMAQNLPPSRRDARKLAELVLGLDEWRKRGGHDPYTAAPDDV